MAMSINTNITSMIGQQNLSESKSALTTSMERLSSGLRINSAKDDAAGQAIANRMTAQVTGLSQAQRNANDGISVAQTAEGALNQVNDNLQRVRELTVQAQNGTNSDKDLASIQDEIGQRLNEINRISEQTDFNGTKVLAEDGGLKVQVGANDGEAISVNLKEINAETLGLSGFNVDGTGADNSSADVQSLLANGFSKSSTVDGAYDQSNFNKASTVDDVFANLKDGGTIADNAGGADYTYSADSNSFSYNKTAATASDIGSDLGLTPSVGESNTITVKLGDVETSVNVDSTGALTDAKTGDNLYLTGTAGSKDLSSTDSSGNGVASIDDLVTEIGLDARESTAASITTAEGTEYSVTSGTAGDGTVNVKGGSIEANDLMDEMKASGNSTIQYNIDLDGDTSDTSDQYNIVDEVVKTTHTAASGTATVTSGFEDDFSLGTNADATVYVNDNGKITDGAANEIYVTEEGGLTKDAVSNATTTEDPLATLDTALNQVDELRSELGAVQNRFESAITNLSTNETNLSAARSRIEDADYATEVADMTKNQILQQAGTSVLAQANQLPQSVLSLLG